jgi:hypothetical protein
MILKKRVDLLRVAISNDDDESQTHTIQHMVHSIVQQTYGVP